MEAARIVEAVFVYKRGYVTVMAQMSDGGIVDVFGFYSDELQFEEWEFEGMTEIQARNLHQRRDVAYLRS